LIAAGKAAQFQSNLLLIFSWEENDAADFSFVAFVDRCGLFAALPCRCRRARSC
jgi:hypothetical protein